MNFRTRSLKDAIEKLYRRKSTGFKGYQNELNIKVVTDKGNF